MNTTPRRVENIITDKGKVPVYATGIVEQPWDGYSDTDAILQACCADLPLGS